MSVFEDLIDELKEENLLEETVLKAGSANSAKRADASDQTVSDANGIVVPKSDSDLDFEAELLATELPPTIEASAAAGSHDFANSDAPIVLQNADFNEDDFPAAESHVRHEVVNPRPKTGEREYFRKRAMDEVTGLQMVEHVLSGVEREQMKIVPKPHDDLPVKLALHDFLQVGSDSGSTEHAQSEFKLMQETENWYSALSHRDRNISVAHIRRFCETTRPALSAQALIALTRFYRNSPFSEPVRSKFELVLTRLFSREADFEHRELLLEHNEMLQQLKELYAEWASIQVYSEDENAPEIQVATLKFADFINEAERTTSFDELLNNDFFNRLRRFKEGCQENFFAPAVTVAAIECNIRIGNRYIELLNRAKQAESSEDIEEKFGFLHDQAVSDATGKTYELLELLSTRVNITPDGPAEIVEVSVKEDVTYSTPAPTRKPGRFAAINTPLLVATIVTVLSCVGLYLWAEYEAGEVRPSKTTARQIPLENSEFKEYLQKASVVDDTLFGITLNTWENMNSEAKQAFLQRLLSTGAEKQFKKVQLINPNGKAVGFASADRIEVYNQ